MLSFQCSDLDLDPHNEATTRLYQCVDGGEGIARLKSSTRSLILNAREIAATEWHDLWIAPKARGRVLGTRLARRAHWQFSNGRPKTPVAFFVAPSTEHGDVTSSFGWLHPARGFYKMAEILAYRLPLARIDDLRSAQPPRPPSHKGCVQLLGAGLNQGTPSGGLVHTDLDPTSAAEEHGSWLEYLTAIAGPAPTDLSIGFTLDAKLSAHHQWLTECSIEPRSRFILYGRTKLAEVNTAGWWHLPSSRLPKTLI